MRRAIILPALSLASLLGLVGLLLAAGWLALQMPAVRGRLAAEIGRAVSAPGQVVTLEGMGGSLPFDVTLAALRIADDQGVWGIAERARVTVSPWVLLRGQLRIERLAADRVAVLRLPGDPASQPSSAPGPALPPRIEVPRLPVAITVDQLAVARIELGAPVLGSPALLTLAADGRAAGADITAHVDLRRIDEEPGTLKVAMAFDGTRLDLDARLDDPDGRLIERLAPGDPRQPVRLTLAGSGPLGSWRGRLELGAGKLVSAQADLTLGEGPDYRLTVDGMLRQDGLLPPDIGALLRDGLTVGAVATWRHDGVLLLERLAIATTLATLDASASFDQATQGLSATAALRLPDIVPVSQLAGTRLAGRLDLDVEVGGTVAKPQMDLRLAGSRLVADAIGVDRLAMRLAVKRSDGAAWRLQGDGAMSTLTAAGTALPAGFGSKLDWTLAATGDPSARRLSVDRFAVTSAGLEAEATGMLEPAGSKLALKAALADLAALKSLAGLPGLRGRVDLTADLAFDADRRLTTTVDASADGIATGIGELDALLGRALTVRLAGARAATGRLAVSRIDIAGRHVTAEAGGEFDPASGLLDAKFGVELPRLAVLGQALGQPLAGRATLAGDIGGTLEKPTIQARLNADAAYDGLPARAELAAALRDLETLRISRIALTAAGAELTGALDIGLTTRRASGKLSGRVPDLAPLSHLAGMPLAGQLGLDLALGTRDGQTAELSLTGSSLVAGGLAIGRIALSGQGTRLDAKPAGRATAEVQDLAAGSARISRTTLTATARQPGDIAFEAAGRGQMMPGMPLDLAATGRVLIDAAGQRAELATLRGRLGPEAIALRRPLKLAVQRDGMRIDDLALSFGSGRIDGAMMLEKAASTIRVKVAGLPLPTLASLGGVELKAGTADVDVDLSGPPDAPRGRIAVEARKLHIPGAGDEGSPPLDVSAVMLPGPERADVEAKVGTRQRVLLALTGGLPLRLSLRPFVADLSQTTPIALKASGEGTLDQLGEFLPIGEDHIGGPYRIALTVGGTLADPQVAGRVQISGGRYLNQRFGTQLLNVNVELAGDGDALRLTRFEGTDANSGRISAEGQIDLKHKPAPALDLRARLQQFQLAASDAMRATSNADIRVGGTVAAPSLFARIQVPRAQFLIPDRLPPTVVNLDVEEIDSRKPASNQRAEQPKKSPPLVVQLDVQLDVPGQTFVRGRGLDSEWRGSINITGTSAAPVLRADIEAVQGTVQLLGTTFTLQRGEISFPSGLSADPYLDILAQHRAADIVAQVLLQGSPLSPRLTLTSQPELPQDQVLSRVLFGKSPGSITAAQGLQLAYAVRTLTTGGPGLIDRLRESTGLDRLDLGGSDPVGGPTVSGGKYIADGVFVGVEQGAKANSTRATVEIEVLPSITARSAVGGTSSLVGVDWQYDY